MFGSADYELQWPRELFVQEAEALLNYRFGDLQGRCELLLSEAFAGTAPVDLFRAFMIPSDPWGPAAAVRSQKDPGEFMRAMIEESAHMRQVKPRTPYWLERRRGGANPGTITSETVVRHFIELVNELEDHGYLEQVFEKDCVDDPSSVDPSSVLELHLGVPELWPLSVPRLESNHDVFFGVIEVLHDLVSRPRNRSLHDYLECGWHHKEFALQPGRTLYRWRVNKLLERSDFGLRLAEDGEDTGRLVAVTDDARTDLTRAMATRDDPATGDRVRHALALFRGRDATEHDKRSAVAALALVLEERRKLLKEELYSKDEGALFTIANGFAIRHSRDDQKTDYDPIFLDWTFWWYLATIELTDRVLARNDRHGD